MQQAIGAKKSLAVHSLIAGRLQDDIRMKRYARGEKLPSEAQLCERFQVNRYTIRLALESLVQAGVIIAHRGKGHFVTIQPLMIEYPLSPMMRFSDAIRANGCTPSLKVLSVRIEHPTEQAAEALGVDLGTLMYRLVILRFADDIPIAWNETWLPVSRVPNLPCHLEHDESLYSIIEQQYGIQLQRVYTTFQSTYPTSQMLSELHVSPNTTILRIETVTQDQFNQRVEYTTAHYRGDLCRISIHYHNH